VAPDSITETFVALRMRVENWRWAGVPIIVRTGKRLARSARRSRSRLPQHPTCLFEESGLELPAPTTSSSRAAQRGISLSFDAKIPGRR